MFGNKSLPSRVYRYHCRIAPESQALVDMLLRRANNYRNLLVENERRRREEVDALIQQVQPQLQVIEQTITSLSESIETVETEIKQIKQRSRPVTKKDGKDEAREKLSKEERQSLKDRRKELQASLKSLKVERKEAYESRKALRKATFSSEAWETASQDIENRFCRLDKLDRSRNGLNWGTYLIVEQAVSDRRKGPPPQFKSFSGNGSLAIQIQGPKDLLVPEAMLKGDNRLSIDSSGKYPTVRLGLGRSRRHNPRPKDEKTKKTILPWENPAAMQLEGPETGSKFQRQEQHILCTMKLHRPMPSDAKITWVKLVCRRVGIRSEWSIQFTLAKAEGWQKPYGSGTVAINLGWRLRPDGVRAAYCVDSQGHQEELILPNSPQKIPDEILAKLAELEQSGSDKDRKKAQRIREAYKRTNKVGILEVVAGLNSVRDKNLNTIKLQLATWLDANRVPESLTERLKTLRSWRSQKRLAGVVRFWRDNRFAGDAEMFDKLVAWDKQDIHLYAWESNAYRHYQDWRNNLYREFADRLAKRYGRVLLADIDWSKIQSRPGLEKTDEAKTIRARKLITSPSILQTALEQRFEEVVLFDPKHATRTHHRCGKLTKTTDTLALMHTCGACKETYDQDYNHCLNLLTIDGKNDFQVA